MGVRFSLSILGILYSYILGILIFYVSCNFIN
jgi:hypothetical protein